MPLAKRTELNSKNFTTSDAVRFYRSIYESAIYGRCIGHIQIDDPTFCYFCNDNMISTMEKEGVDHEALLETYIRAINVCTQDRPADLTVGVHMCRGNFKVWNQQCLVGVQC